MKKDKYIAPASMTYCIEEQQKVLTESSSMDANGTKVEKGDDMGDGSYVGAKGNDWGIE